jgi:serine/threonine protein kinase
MVRSLHCLEPGALHVGASCPKNTMPTAPEVQTTDDDLLRRSAAHVGELVSERWRLDSLIGVGGMASVYAATHRNGKRVAIKMLHPELSTDAGVRQRFIDEGYVANRVKSPGTVSVLDDGETEDGLVFLVMDLLEGQTLDERLRKRHTLHPREVVAIAEGLLNVLAAAHDEGIVHRDIKPANIFITHDGSVRLLDFGIARLTAPGQARTTQWGVMMGTPAFMPPEQARGHWEQVDGRTDLWAVGATMFMALSGHPVHAAATANEELLSAMTRKAPSLGDVVPGTPRRLVELIDRALAFDPGERWPDARVMQAALRAVQLELESQPPRMASTSERPDAIAVATQAVGRPKVSLVPRGMWIAKTRSWCFSPMESVSDTPSDTSSTLRNLPQRKRASHVKRRAILVGIAAFALVFVGRTGHTPPTHADSPSTPTTTLQPPPPADSSDPSSPDRQELGPTGPSPEHN